MAVNINIFSVINTLCFIARGGEFLLAYNGHFRRRFFLWYTAGNAGAYNTVQAFLSALYGVIYKLAMTSPIGFFRFCHSTGACCRRNGSSGPD